MNSSICRLKRWNKAIESGECYGHDQTHGTHRFGSEMMKRRRGRIVIVSSLAGAMPGGSQQLQCTRLLNPIREVFQVHWDGNWKGMVLELLVSCQGQ